MALRVPGHRDWQAAAGLPWLLPTPPGRVTVLSPSTARARPPTRTVTPVVLRLRIGGRVRVRVSLSRVYCNHDHAMMTRIMIIESVIISAADDPRGGRRGEQRRLQP